MKIDLTKEEIENKIKDKDLQFVVKELTAEQEDYMIESQLEIIREMKENDL